MNAVPDTSNSAVREFCSRVACRDLTVGIIGLGYVGLPMALTAVKAGFKVIGFDIDQQRVAELSRGECAIKHIDTIALSEAVAKKRFRATSDYDELVTPDAILIAVPTPLNRHREPDLSFVETSTREIARHLRRGQLVVLESTTWPGTTAEVMKPILEARGLVCGVDFFLAYSPEREDPGNTQFGTATIPKVIGADDPNSLFVANMLYKALVATTVPVSSAATAEAVKLTENIFRAVNIALVNELKIIYERMGIDVWEVIEAAKTKPFGYMPFYPGPGLGGHCIPIDPFYLTWKARQYDIVTRFIELAGEINTAMPHYVVDRLATALDRRYGRGLNGARILVIGLAYKKNIADPRESPALKLIELIERRGAKADYHDPFIATIPVTRAYPELAGRKSQSIAANAVAGYDAVLIATDHDAIDWANVVANARLVIDTRNVCQRNGIDAAYVVKA